MHDLNMVGGLYPKSTYAPYSIPKIKACLKREKQSTTKDGVTRSFTITFIHHHQSTVLKHPWVYRSSECQKETLRNS